ncbi:hypothetical protein M9H77_19185 [Catharanthus roseus]|uniref:Uncharacterized protein n=1 Tax=Catharanthus roseus TaxID=4058 RepID=A0ACC0B9K1_CATRO|nr:hypothetical protein M9H77_19185 [Catharanthus roseus]
MRPNEPNKKEKVRENCKTKACGWWIFVSVENASKSKDLVIKAMTLKHENRSHEWKSKFNTAKCIAERSIERVKLYDNILEPIMERVYGQMVKVWILIHQRHASSLGCKEVIPDTQPTQELVPATDNQSTQQPTQANDEARLGNQQSRSEAAATHAPNTTTSSALPTNPKKKRTNSRATRLYEEFGRAWLGEGGSRNIYNFEQPLLDVREQVLERRSKVKLMNCLFIVLLLMDSIVFDAL